MITTEIIGYAAMACVGLSLSMKKIKQLRIWNLVGALLFVIYGIAIESMPVLILNVFLSAVNIYHLLATREQAQ